MTAVEGPCACSGPHFHSVVHDCCAENADLRARLAAVLALCDQQPNETPCSCDPAYTERGLIAPGCAWHQDIESFVADVRAAGAGDDRG